MPHSFRVDTHDVEGYDVHIVSWKSDSYTDRLKSHDIMSPWCYDMFGEPAFDLQNADEWIYEGTKWKDQIMWEEVHFASKKYAMMFLLRWQQ